MSLDDRIRAQALEARLVASMESSLDGWRDRVAADVRNLLDHVITIASEDRLAALGAERARAARALAGTLTRVLDGVRRLDDGSTLTAVLDALATAVSAEAPRTAIYLCRDDRAVGWRASGFGEHDREPQAFVVSRCGLGLLGSAMRAAKTMRYRGEGAEDGLPAEAPMDAGDRLAVPIVVGAHVAAVVYADGVHDSTDAGGWCAAIEILARHAGRCLERLTLERTSLPPALIAGVDEDLPATLTPPDPAAEMTR
ncbi:MAG: hypothetical protein ACT4QD_20975 [Acidobacteriota bacterium]